MVIPYFPPARNTRERERDTEREREKCHRTGMPSKMREGKETINQHHGWNGCPLESPRKESDHISFPKPLPPT